MNDRVNRFAFWVTTCRSSGLCKVPTDGGPRRKCVINQQTYCRTLATRARAFYDLPTAAQRALSLSRDALLEYRNEPKLRILRPLRTRRSARAQRDTGRETKRDTKQAERQSHKAWRPQRLLKPRRSILIAGKIDATRRLFRDV